MCNLCFFVTPGFKLSFQMVKNHSLLTTRSYVEYTGEMKTSTTTFTACFWFNIQYFSFSSNYLWQFCFIRSQEDLPSCTAFGIKNKEGAPGHCLLVGFKQNLQTLGQDLDILLKAAGGKRKCACKIAAVVFSFVLSIFNFLLQKDERNHFLTAVLMSVPKIQS